MANIHSPQRQQGESLQAYRERRAASKREVRRVLGGELLAHHIGHSRRHAIKAAGGRRQFKRAQYLQHHDGYAAKHPVMAAQRGY